jgi:3-vinyl bacteriochlorophyllide hydratase
MTVHQARAEHFSRDPPAGAVVSALYTPEQRARRDSSGWTQVQGVLAPIQFLACLVSMALICRFMLTGEGLFQAHLSVWVKTLLLLTIMVTGAIWEKVVFGQYLFTRAFFWEDVMSMIVIAVHLFYAWAAMQTDWPQSQILSIALIAYVLYLINAAQFIYKLRQARASSAVPPEGQTQ